jgi:sulfatase modifying factor 1
MTHDVSMPPSARNPQSAVRPKNMVWIPGGTFVMGSDDFYPEERPVHRATVPPFWMDEHPVTVAEFRRFVIATGYITVAERSPDPTLYPGAAPEDLAPGSLVFRQTAGPVPLTDVAQWWSWIPGASWRHPEGPGSNVGGRERHPVTHVTFEDAAAYARWAGKDLSTEAEWEIAARGGLDQATYAWGDEFAPRGRMMANTWQGEFPSHNLLQDRFERTSPIGSFPPNGYGLLDVTGNVWEWTTNPWSPAAGGSGGGCCSPAAVSGGTEPESALPHIPQRVIKGGSHLCAPNYCHRYRPAARQGEAIDTSTSHIGFRCVMRTDG